MLGSDEIFIFIDSDYDASTGYMSESIGADKLIHIVGHYGIITSSTIGNYNGIDNEWNWIGNTDTPTANDYNEIETLGEDGNYYLHITSWDNEKDDIEAEIYNKVTLPEEEPPKDGSRAGTPTFPTSWTLLDADDDDGVTSDVEILELYYAVDGTYIFFKIVTESNVDLSDSTLGIIIDDVSIGSGTYDAACGSFRWGSSDRGYVYSWDSIEGGWDRVTGGNDYNDHIEVNDGHSGIQLACQKTDFDFTIDTTNDKIRAVSGDSGNKEFENNWLTENIPSSSRDDITDAAALGIPEFSTIMMPVASVLLIVGNRIRNKKNYQQ